MALGRTARYYKYGSTIPGVVKAGKARKARAKKKKLSAEINKRPGQVKKRVETAKKRKEARKKGKNITGKDYDHHAKRFIKSSKNRGRSNEGGRKKVKNKNKGPK